MENTTSWWAPRQDSWTTNDFFPKIGFKTFHTVLFHVVQIRRIWMAENRSLQTKSLLHFRNIFKTSTQDHGSKLKATGLWKNSLLVCWYFYACFFKRKLVVLVQVAEFVPWKVIVYTSKQEMYSKTLNTFYYKVLHKLAPLKMKLRNHSVSTPYLSLFSIVWTLKFNRNH